MKKIFYLGGHDAEMITIKTVATANGYNCCDKNLQWGAKASAYIEEIKEAIKDGFTPVLIELKQDIDTSILDQCVIVDHHDEYVGRKASILQVLELLGIEPTKKHLIIAANDEGGIKKMVAMGATRQEIEETRFLDETAQGISQELHAQAVAEYHNRQEINGVFVVKQKVFCFGPVTDLAYWDQKDQNVLIVCEDGRTVWFHTPETAAAVYAKYPKELGSWRGGNFFGNPSKELQPEIVEFILKMNQ